MPASEEIISSIEKRVKDSKVFRYSLWAVGISSTPKQCQNTYDYPPQFICWEAEDEDAARNIREHFLQKGMKAATGHSERNPRYVFIF